MTRQVLTPNCQIRPQNAKLSDVGRPSARHGLGRAFEATVVACDLEP